MLFLTVLACTALVPFRSCHEVREAVEAHGTRVSADGGECAVALTCPRENPERFMAFSWYQVVRGTKRGLFYIQDNGTALEYELEESISATHKFLGSNSTLLISPISTGYEGSYECSRWANVGHRNEQYSFSVSNCSVTLIVKPPSPSVWAKGGSTKPSVSSLTLLTLSSLGILILL